MITDQKRITDMLLSTATLASFALPGGPVIAGTIGTVQLLFDIFVPGIPQDPGARAPTLGDLQLALNDLAGKIDEDLWQKDFATMEQVMLTQNDKFMSFWNWMASVKLDKIDVPESAVPGAKVGASFIVDTADYDCRKQLESYCNTGLPDNARDALLTALRIIANPSDKNSTPAQLVLRKTQNTSLYCLVASTLIAYYKAVVIWQWGHDHVLKYNAYNAYDRLNRLWSNPAYAANHSQPISPLEPTEQPPGEPDWNSFSQPVKVAITAQPSLQLKPVPAMLQIINEILLHAEGDGTDTHPGLYTTMFKNWYIDRPKKITDRVKSLSIQTDASKYWYHDSATGEVSVKVDNRQFAEFHMEAKRGSLIAYYWEHWTQAYGLNGVTEDAITAFGDAIKLWKQARASIDFKVYTVVPGDTLPSIARKAKFLRLDGTNAPWYPSPLYDKAIFDANKILATPSGTGTINWTQAQPITGQLLTLPDPKSAGFTIYTVTATDKVPNSILDKFAAPGTPAHIDYYQLLIRFNPERSTDFIHHSAAPGTELRIPPRPS